MKYPATIDNPFMGSSPRPYDENTMSVSNLSYSYKTNVASNFSYSYKTGNASDSANAKRDSIDGGIDVDTWMFKSPSWTCGNLATGSCMCSPSSSSYAAPSLIY